MRGRSHFLVGRRRASRPPVAMVQLVNPDLAAERIAVDAQQTRGPRLISIGAVQHSLDEFFLKLVHRFFKQNASLDHLTHKRFELIFHGLLLRKTLLVVSSPQNQESSTPANRR